MNDQKKDLVIAISMSVNENKIESSHDLSIENKFLIDRNNDNRDYVDILFERVCKKLKNKNF